MLWITGLPIPRAYISRDRNDCREGIRAHAQAANK
jgi:hypothetical protein